MLFACFMIDNPGTTEKRDELRPVHREYLKASEDKLYLAGPLWNDARNKMLGSLYVVEQPDKKATEAWLAEEPFSRNGLFGAEHVYGWQHLKGERTVKDQLFLYFQLGGPKNEAVRGKWREQHSGYLETWLDNLFAAGPLYNDSDKTEPGDRIGSLFIADFPDRARADEWRGNEPFTRYGAYGDCWGYAYENLWRLD
jgi:uncharacterized protein YciI